jgi:deazaflavin-dependent oxidoreductase (nitroreductase family)
MARRARTTTPALPESTAAPPAGDSPGPADPETPLPGAPAAGSLAPPPPMTGVFGILADASRTAFRYANRYAMVPFHRAGLAAWLGNPVTGWQCLLTTTGRRSGLRRHTPLGYFVADGAAWVLAGYGPSTLWFRNILDDPRVELLLPGRPPLAANATHESDPSTRARIIPALCRSMALPGAMTGCFPPTSSDRRILECVSWVPLVRIAPADGSRIAQGPDDPGGLGWTWRVALATWLSLVGLRAIRARLCRRT